MGGILKVIAVKIFISNLQPPQLNLIIISILGKGLGGVALFDLSTEDIRGSCTPGQTFPILMKVKEKLK